MIGVEAFTGSGLVPRARYGPGRLALRSGPTGFGRRAQADETRLPGDPIKVDPYPRALGSTEPEPRTDPGTGVVTPPGPGQMTFATPPPLGRSGCASCDTTAGGGLAGLGLLALVGLGLRRRRR